MRRNIIKSLALAVIVSTVVTQPALAYVDPNTGGLLFQLLAVLFVFFSGIVLFFSSKIRMAFNRAKRFVHNLLDR